MQIIKTQCPHCGQDHNTAIQPAVAPQATARQLVTVEYWPNTNKWRILVGGVAVGYWDSEDEARTRARQVRRSLIEQLCP
jgi:hypothetical protein